MNLLPAPVRSFLERREVVRQVVANSGWLFFDKVVRLGIGLLVVGWLARYLGPGRFGEFSFTLAIVALFAPIAALGLDSIVVRDLVRDVDAAPEILGTTFGAKFVASVAVWPVCVASVYFLKDGNPGSVELTAILALTIVAGSGDAIDFWFRSRQLSRNIAIARITGFTAGAALTIFLILNEAPLLGFAGARVLESFLVALLLVALYRHSVARGRRWRFSIGRLRGLLKDSWPLILSGFVIMVYMRTDQVMLEYFLGDAAVGQFSAAIRVSEFFYFIPVGIVSAALPAIVRARAASAELYQHRTQSLFSGLVLLAYLVAATVTVFSAVIIRAVFGDAYGQASLVLVIYVWASPFVYLGVARGAWINTEGLMVYSFVASLAGAILNIILNLWFIPVLGLAGPAYATLITQAFAAVLSGAFFSKLRPVLNMQLRAFFLSGLRSKPAG